MKNLFMLLIAVGLISNANAQQKSNFIMSYPVGIPTGSLSDYIGATAFRGISLEGTHLVSPNLAIGLEAAWNSFYERAEQKTYTQETVSVSGVQYRYEYALPIIAGAKYHFNTDSKIKPYGGVGIGTVYIDRNTDFGIYRFSTETWQFSVRPELGIKYEYAPGRGMIFGAKYFSNSGNDNLDGQSFFTINLGIVL